MSIIFDRWLEDISKQKCITCFKLKIKEFLKFMPRSYGQNSRYKTKNKCKRSVYADETGRQWNGNQCPDCKYLQI